MSPLEWLLVIWAIGMLLLLGGLELGTQASPASPEEPTVVDYPASRIGSRCVWGAAGPPQGIAVIHGSQDGGGAGDHDAPYRFGQRPGTTATYPFSMHQYARLLVLRSRVQAGLFGADDLAAD